MANDPIPNVVVASGPKASAPGGAIPIALYGAGLPAYAFPSALGEPCWHCGHLDNPSVMLSGPG